MAISLALRIYQKIATLWKTRNYLFILAVALVHKIDKMKQIKGLLALVGGALVIASCSLLPGKKGGKPTAINPGQLSTATNLQYNDDQNGGFQVKDFEGQPDAPNTVFIEGGRAIMGSFEEDV